MSELAMSKETGRGLRRKVVFVECAAAMGGVQFSTLYLLQHLDPAIWEAVLVCPAEGDLTEACRRLGVRVHVLKQPALRSTSFRIGSDIRIPDPTAWLTDGMGMLIAARRLARYLAQEKPALLVTKGLFPHFYGGLAARKLRIPCIWHAQDLISERHLGLYRRGFGFAAGRLPDHIIADGAAIGRQLPRRVQDRISVIHNGVDSGVFRPGLNGASVREELDLSPGAIVIGHLARITPWKGQHHLLEAFAKIAKGAPEASLLFVGDPVFDNDSYQRDLLDLTAKLGLKERVRFAGYRHDIQEVLAAMDIFAFTSVEKDTSPLALLSAMSSGLPIVAFDIEGIRELIDGDEYLWTVPCADVDALAKALLRLISDKRLRAQLGQSARRLAERRFSLERHVAGVEEVLLKVDQQRGPAFNQPVAALAHHPSPNANDCS